ncbi:MAG TPA: sugar transferase [Gemmatimonadales bacterium]|nr:sugar transferase [Gemmatimonadales bacterium]
MPDRDAKGSLILPRPISVGRAFRLPLDFSERRILLTGIDLVAVNSALILALGFRPHPAVDPMLVARHPYWFLILSGLWLITGHAFDVYEPRVAGRFEASVPQVIKAAAVAVLLYLVIPYITPPLPTSRWTLASFPCFLIAGLLLGRAIYSWALPMPLYERRALIIGAGWAGRAIAEALVTIDRVGYHLVGFVDDDPGKAGTLISVAAIPPADGDGPAGLPVLGSSQGIADLIAQHRVSTLILAIPGEVDADLLHILMGCVERGVEMVPMPVIYEQLTGRVPVERVGEKWYASIPVYPRVTGTLWQIAKRMMDIALASVGVACLLPLLPFVALAIRLDSPGPIFYVQERIGKGGSMFRAYKFRSMFCDAEKDGAVWAQEHDPRVTRVGRVLRAAHIDEFPQFLNVLRGEMSIVGPRPERPEFVEELVVKFPVYRLRHIAKPGMGGWGLVRQGYASSHEDALVRLQYDLYYIKHQSLGLDLLIILKTIMHAFALKGR